MTQIPHGQIGMDIVPHLIKAGVMQPYAFHFTCGIVGSGKSTYVMSFMKANPGYEVISPDFLRLQYAGDMADQSKNHFIFSKVIPEYMEEVKARGHGIMYDATCYNRKNRKDVIRKARELGYRVVAHVFNTPFDECVRRNAERARVVPLSVLERMRDGWVAPTLEEVDEIVEVTS